MPQFPAEYGTSPVGRIVMHPREGLFEKGQTNQNNQPLPLDKQKFFVGLAVEKTAPGVDDMLATLQKAALAGYQSNPVVMQQIQMGLAAPAFSWKVQDGDEMVQNPQTGQMEARTPYAAGCWIFKFSTTIDMQAAKCIPGQHTEAVYCDKSEIYKGAFVQISYSTSANGNLDHTAGVYLNPRTICLVGYGEPIQSGPSLQQQFSGGTGGYTPNGMSTTPPATASATAGMGQPPAGNPGMMQQQGQNPGMMQQPGVMQNGGMQADPNAGMMQNGGMQADPNAGMMGNPMGANQQMQGNGMNTANMATSSPTNGGMPPPDGQNPGYGGYMNG